MTKMVHHGNPKTHEIEGFYTPNIWVITVITPKNEGFGFPWHFPQN